ncbi:sigma-54-dependent transcriptional regulator [Neotabrizicola sp. VNH66]|uniref:sigma-54-dependent transcriptional regulator n=1 Tax=Neotabrizicola sp. VNH66 TaxID=3400918 RepID=UPI003C03A491
MPEPAAPPPRKGARPPALRRGAPVVLVVDPAPSERTRHLALLASAGFDPRPAATADEALRLFRSVRPQAVLIEPALPDRDGLALIAEFRSLRPATGVIVLAAAMAAEGAVAALRAGASDVLQKPADEARLVGALRDAAGQRPAPGSASGRTTGAGLDPATFIGSSPAMARVHATIAAVARSMATVFITGESGTGKELAALAIHAQSTRPQGPFIALNCGAIPPDLLESEVFGHVKGSFTGAITDKPGAAVAADGGTLFLDEICEMAPALQTKLLRFLQTSTVTPVGATRPRQVDVRIVCATNRDPMEAVRRGHFREDLYYRLYVVPLHMPPLRDRGSDVVQIAAAALTRFAAEEGKVFDGLAPETETFLLAQDWPGNVRQLLNVIRNVAVLHPGGLVRPEMLPPGFPPQPQAAPLPVPAGEDPFRGLTLAEVERQAVAAALARNAGSVPRAARDLDVSPSTLYRKLQAWGQRTGE